MLINPDLLDQAFPPGTRKRRVVELWLRAQMGELGIKVTYRVIAAEARTTEECVKNIVSEFRRWCRELAAALAEQGTEVTRTEFADWLIRAAGTPLDRPGWLGARGSPRRRQSPPRSCRLDPSPAAFLPPFRLPFAAAAHATRVSSHSGSMSPPITTRCGAQSAHSR